VALVADRQAPVGQQPGQRPLDLPTVAAQPLAGLHPTACNPRADSSPAERPPARPEVVPLIGMQLGRSLARPTRLASWPDDRRNRVRQLLQQQRVVGVGRRQPARQWQAGGVDQQVVLGAGLAAVDWIRASQLPTSRSDTHAVDRGPRPVDLAVVAQPVQQPMMQVLPHSGLLPVAQPSPAGHAAPAAWLLGREQPPGHPSP
jgi:hypothetical protein